jgi:hypothetical protein
VVENHAKSRGAVPELNRELIPMEVIEGKIVILRERRVMVDRVPDDFMFQATLDEANHQVPPLCIHGARRANAGKRTSQSGCGPCEYSGGPRLCLKVLQHLLQKPPEPPRRPIGFAGPGRKSQAYPAKRTRAARR